MCVDENKEYLLFDEIEENVVTEKFLLDAQHIATATVARVNVIVRWNFKHSVIQSR